MSGKLLLKIPRRHTEENVSQAPTKSGPSQRKGTKRHRADSSEDESPIDSGTHARATRRGSNAYQNSQQPSDDEVDEAESSQSRSGDDDETQPPSPKGKGSASTQKLRQKARRIVSDPDSDASMGEPESDEDEPASSKSKSRVASQQKLARQVSMKFERKSTVKGDYNSEHADRLKHGQAGEPPTKKKKLPTITKRVGPGLPVKPTTTPTSKIGPGKIIPPVPIQTGTLTGSKDFDFKDAANVAALMKSAAMMQTKVRDPKQEVYDKMRAEARKAREEEARKDTFDLMAGTEKIKAFEIQLESMNSLSAPHILAHPIVRWLNERDGTSTTAPRT